MIASYRLCPGEAKQAVMCPGATIDYLAPALLSALSFNNPTTLSSHQLITWHFFGAQPFSQTSSLLTLALKKGLYLTESFKPLVIFETGRIVSTKIGSGLCCVSGLEMEVPCCSIRGIVSIFHTRRTRNLACQSWNHLSSFAVLISLNGPVLIGFSLDWIDQCHCGREPQ